jgi:hypothetical protein
LPTRIADLGDRLPIHVGDHDHDAQQLGERVLDGLRAVDGEHIAQRQATGSRQSFGLLRSIRAGRGRGRHYLPTQPALDLRPGESPLLAYTDRRQPTAFDQTIDRGAVNVQQVLDVVCGQQVGHEIAQRSIHTQLLYL